MRDNGYRKCFAVRGRWEMRENHNNYKHPTLWNADKKKDVERQIANDSIKDWNTRKDNERIRKAEEQRYVGST